VKFINRLAILRAKMSIEEHCREGEVPVGELVDTFLKQTPIDADGLRLGDYLVLPVSRLPYGSGLRTEEIVKIGDGNIPPVGGRYVEPGDFLTRDGTTGPISGNLYLRLGQPPIILRGDKLPTSPDSAVGIIGFYTTNQRVLASR